MYKQTKSLDRIAEDYLGEGLAEQEALLSRENSSNTRIIRAEIHATEEVATTAGATEEVATTAGGIAATAGATAEVTEVTPISTISMGTVITTTITPSSTSAVGTTTTTASTSQRVVTGSKTPTTPGTLSTTADHQANKNDESASSYVRRSLCNEGDCAIKCCTVHRICHDPLLYRRSVGNSLSNLLHTNCHYELAQLCLKISVLLIFTVLIIIFSHKIGAMDCKNDATGPHLASKIAAI